MKITLFLIWLALPLAWLGWHYGPGQEYLKLDDSDQAVKTAQTATTLEDQLKGWDSALTALPKTETAQIYRLRLARSEALFDGHQLPDATRELEALYMEMKDDPAAEPAVLNRVQEKLATAKYYRTWLMRLEGHPQEAWEPEIESARQHFRVLAERTSADRERYQQNLESSIRLARVDLLELQGQPLPEPGQGTRSGKGKSPGPPKPGKPGDEDARGAGGKQPVDGEGS